MGGLWLPRLVRLVLLLDHCNYYGMGGMLSGCGVTDFGEGDGRSGLGSCGDIMYIWELTTRV